jgi:hypothetical protein
MSRPKELLQQTFGAVRAVAAGTKDAVLDYAREQRARQPPLKAQGKAILREAVKDVRSTLHQVFFGQPEHMPEPGTPLNPTPQLTTAELTGRPMDIHRDMPQPSKQRQQQMEMG